MSDHPAETPLDFARFDLSRLDFTKFSERFADLWAHRPWSAVAFITVALGIVYLTCWGLKKALWWISGVAKYREQLQFQQKSAEVRLGKLAETLAPLSADFPVDPRKPGTSTVFIGQPVDYIHFDPEEGVTFIEIKSGEARLSSFQSAIQSAVEEGRIAWAEFRPDQAAQPRRKSGRR